MKHLLYILGATLLFACADNSQKVNETQSDQPVQTIAQSFITDDTIKVIASGETMAEINFDKKVIRVPANKAITIALTNESSDATMPHNLVIIKQGTANEVGQNGLKFKENGYVNPEDENVIAHSPLAQINTTVYFSFTTPSAGEYEFICSYPGHWGLMKGGFVTK